MIDPVIEQALDRIAEEEDALRAKAEAELNPSMKQQYLDQADYAFQKGKQIYDSGRLPTGAEKIRAGAQGLTLGYADEIEAAARTPFSDDSYVNIRNDIRGQNKAFQEQFPRFLNLAAGGGAEDSRDSGAEAA